MEEFISKITDKVGISEDQAKKVFAFLKDNAEQIPEWIGKSDIVDTVKDKLPGGLGNLF